MPSSVNVAGTSPLSATMGLVGNVEANVHCAKVHLKYALENAAEMRAMLQLSFGDLGGR